MKKHTILTLCFLALFLIKHTASAQVNVDFSNSQIQGYTLFGLGFSTVAYTYSGQNDINKNTGQRALFYSIGAGLAIAGVAILIVGPKKKSRSFYWSGMKMAKTPNTGFDYRNYLLANKN